MVKSVYKCWICNREFDAPKTYHYREDMNGEGAWQDFYVNCCPYCGSDEIDELTEQEERNAHL